MAASRPAISAADFNRLEFHRSAVALMPDPADKRPGIAFQIDGGPKQVAQQFCSCRTSGTATCAHQKELSRVLAARGGENEDRSFYDRFQFGLWHRLATVLAEAQRETPATIRLATIKSAGPNRIKVIGSNDRTLLCYFSAELDRVRFLERCTQPPADAAVPTRGEIIRQLALLTLTKNERVLMDRGLKTRRQVLEETFWYKFAYHCFREFGANGCTLHPAIDESSGAFMVSGRAAQDHEVFKFEIPRNLVKRVLLECAGMFCNQHGLAISPIPLDAIFDIKLTANLDIEISPLLRAVSKEGEAKFFQREDLKRFQYGDLYYIKELNLLAEDCYPEPPPKSFDDPV
jgi:hypothetical protein